MENVEYNRYIEIVFILLAFELQELYHKDTRIFNSFTAVIY